MTDQSSWCLPKALVNFLVPLMTDHLILIPVNLLQLSFTGALQHSFNVALLLIAAAARRLNGGGFPAVRWHRQQPDSGSPLGRGRCHSHTTVLRMWWRISRFPLLLANWLEELLFGGVRSVEEFPFLIRFNSKFRALTLKIYSLSVQ